MAKLQDQTAGHPHLPNVAEGNWTYDIKPRGLAFIVSRGRERAVCGRSEWNLHFLVYRLYYTANSETFCGRFRQSFFVL